MVDEGVDGWKSNFCITNRRRTYDRVCRVDNFLFLAGEDSKDRATQEVLG